MCIIEWRTPSNIPNMQSEILKAFLKRVYFLLRKYWKTCRGHVKFSNRQVQILGTLNENIINLCKFSIIGLMKVSNISPKYETQEILSHFQNFSSCWKLMEFVKIGRCNCTDSYAAPVTWSWWVNKSNNKVFSFFTYKTFESTCHS